MDVTNKVCVHVLIMGITRNNYRKEAMSFEPIDTVKVYHILQCLWFVVMAMLIMRLKVFLTPQLALLSSLVANKVSLFLIMPIFIQYI